MKKLISDILTAAVILLAIGGTLAVYGLFTIGVAGVTLYAVGVGLIIVIGAISGVAHELEEIGKNEEERL